MWCFTDEYGREACQQQTKDETPVTHQNQRAEVQVHIKGENVGTVDFWLTVKGGGMAEWLK